jgi:hypothetical protein
MVLLFPEFNARAVYGWLADHPHELVILFAGATLFFPRAHRVVRAARLSRTVVAWGSDRELVYLESILQRHGIERRWVFDDLNGQTGSGGEVHGHHQSGV